MWQRKFSPKAMAKLVELVLTNGKAMEDEVPSGDLLQQDFCEELATLLTSYCGGKLVAIDDAGCFLIQQDNVVPDLERSIWRFAGEACEDSEDRPALRTWLAYPTGEAAAVTTPCTDWLPISTAPKDCYCLGLDPALKRPFVMIWNVADSAFAACGGFGDEKPTLWMPLPAIRA